MFEKLHSRIILYVRKLQLFVDRIWYPPLIGFLSAVDNFIVVIPNDGILISSSMLAPRRWMTYTIAITIGSTVGALLLSLLVVHQGFPIVLELYPGINESTFWQWTVRFFDDYGLILVFLVAVTPLAQQPAVILASLAHTSLFQLITVIFVGRFIKYAIMAYIGSHAPRLLSKLWGVKGELKEAGIDI